MTVNITINADTLEIYQDGELISIKAKEAEKKDKPESENDWIVRRKLKPITLEKGVNIKEGLYFYRNNENSPWQPVLCQMSLSGWFPEGLEFLGPITPDMFL